MAAGVGEGPYLVRFEPGTHRGRQGVRLLTRGAPVVGEQRPADVFGPAGEVGVGGQDGGGRLVQPLALAGEQLVVDGFAHQGVPEAAPVASLHQDVVGDGLAQRFAHLDEWTSGHRRQQPIVDRAARRGGLAEHGLGRLGQPSDAGKDGVSNGVGGTRTRPDCEQLFGVERVALGTDQHVVDDRVGRHSTGDAGQQHGELTAGHPRDPDVLHGGAAGQLAQQRSHRVATMDVVGSIADHQGNLRRAQVPSQERDEVPGRRVGPVQILDDHDQPGRVLTQRFEQRQRLLQDRPGTHLALVAPTAQQRPQLGRHLVEQPVDHLDAERRPQPTQHLDERAIADPDVAEIDAATHRRHAAAGLQPPAQLIDQAGLADTGVATDEHQLRFASSRVRRTFEMAQLGLASDERWTRDPLRHRLSMQQPSIVLRARALFVHHAPSVRIAATPRIRSGTSNLARCPLSILERRWQ